MEEIQTKIDRLCELQKQIRHWRLGGVIGILVAAACCLWHTRTQALALVDDGPTHDRFLSEYKTGLVRDLVPEAKKLTAHTVNRLAPALEQEMDKIERRIPEIEMCAEKEMKLLRENLPERAARAFKPTLGKAIEKHVVLWKKQYPNLTSDQLDNVSRRLTKEVQDRMANIASLVVLPYESSYESIVNDLGEISKLERGQPETDPWDLAVIALGLMQEELEKISPQTRQTLMVTLNNKESK